MGCIAEILLELLFRFFGAAAAALSTLGSRIGDWLWEVEAQGLREWLREARPAKRMRFVAWGLTLTWAACAMVVLLVLVPLDVGWTGEEVLFCSGPFMLPVLAAVIIPVRSEAVGGVVLMLLGLFLCYGGGLELLALGVPPLLAGSLFLASWWKSRTSEGPENTEQDAG